MDKIAIIGTACLFPGAETPEAYWENLLANKDSRISADAEHMGREPNDYFSPDKNTKDKYYCTTGGYIKNFHFNSEGYYLAAKKLEALDNTVQWALHVSREALKDSGYSQNSDKLSRCGVILGNLSFPTKKSNKLFLPLYHQAMATPLQQLLDDSNFKMGGEAIGDLDNGSVAGLPASLINQALELGDVSMVLDAACASSLYSMKLACSYLLSNKADMMLAGAVSAADPWFVSMGFSTFTAFPDPEAKNGISRPLDQNSTGLNTAEGAGMFVLKRYQDAIDDGDNIHAVISGIGLSNDGRGKFVLSPNQSGQEICYQRAYENSDIKPQDVDYIECHATGTPLGDDTEIRSMDGFFGEQDIHFSMGTAKSNFGHLLTSAGMAGMLKIILAMKNDLLPATVNINQAMTSENKKIAGEHILTQNKSWKNNQKVAAINAFGFGGTNAHLILQNHLAKKMTTKNQPKNKKSSLKAKHVEQDISIIGMGAYFGSSKNLSEFEETIYQSKQLISELPEKRWQGMENNSKIKAAFAGGIPQGNFIDNFDFDHLYFKIPPEQQAPLLPQQLLMMKVLDAALQDADLPKGGNIGVIVAMEMDLGIHQFRGRIDASWQLQESLKNSNISFSAEQQLQLSDILKDSLHNAVEINQFTSFIGNIIPCRICSLWDFSGPAFTISAEENSVFKALEVAKLFLESGDVDAMVVGAVDLAGGFEHVYLQNQRHNLDTNSGSGLSYAENSTGWTIGEGAGAIVLKRSDQIAKEQRVYASINALSGKRDISTQNLTQVANDALLQAGITKDAIDYLELNSSGVQEQDQQEAAALFSSYDQQAIALGSIKANIGHTFAASGIASIIKTALCLYQRFIPGIPSWDKPKNREDWENQKFYFPVQSRPWLINNTQHKRYAAINSLGQDDSCYHLILSEAEQQKNQQQTPANDFFENLSIFMFPIAANSQQQLLSNLSELIKNMDESTDLAVLAISKLAEFNKAKPAKAKYRLFILAHNIAELERETNSAIKGVAEAITSEQEWSTPLGSYFTPAPQAAKGKVAFVYPGGFNSYIGMARNIFHMFPEVIDLVKDSTSSLKKMMRTHYVYPETVIAPDKKAMKQLEAQMGDDAIAMFESGIMTSIIYTKVIQELLGVKPQAAFGHSMGELSMLFASGAWPNTDYMSDTLHTTATFHNRLVGDMDVVRTAWNLPPAKEGDKPIWGTYTLRCSPEKAQTIIDEEPRVFLIIINAPNEIVIAGDDEACKRVVKKLKWRLFPVPIKDVVHNELVKAEFDALKELHTMPSTAIKGVDFYTAADYKKTAIKDEVIGHNIATFYTHMVDFPKLVNQVYDDGARIFIELGPQASCTKWISESLKGKTHLSVGINRKGVDDYTSLLRLAAKLSSHGVEMDLEKLYPKLKQPQTSKPGLVKAVVLGKKPFAEFIVESSSKIQLQKIAAAAPVVIAKPKPKLTTAVKPIDTTDSITAKVITQPVAVAKSNSNTAVKIMETNKVVKVREKTIANSNIAKKVISTTNMATTNTATTNTATTNTATTNTATTNTATTN
ncbi:MAG: PfaB family protein, partial [Pseudomonadota bacterium]